ncbi:lipoprotein insertase outer membrane protein LolB [Candidatus Hoaglandella endobia]|uniref:Outer-membrane lipoprotein LolB n=1 Tax=Candidatus Hoaglandella endobia TaxID=1778263 RepID=A0A143WTR4_9ENTR|nr:lipoprotein insertase outer membrane protein LolB [Candidatus Hoaglandella endobia]CUX97241.1 Outer-membrane lipoprotein LolB precursor [Candidatus Hoaglandella endobia]
MLEHYRAVFYFLPLSSLLLLTACSVHTPSCTAKSQLYNNKWRSHQQSVVQLTRYQTRGAFAYLSSQQKVYARFNLQQTSTDRYRLLLINPLGSTEIDLKVQLGSAQLINKQGKHYVSDNPEVIIQKLTGMIIPLSELRQWLIGLPGDTTDFTLNSCGHLRTLTYNSKNGQSWRLIYLSYHNDTLPHLPANIELYQGDKRIKLKIDNWIL